MLLNQITLTRYRHAAQGGTIGYCTGIDIGKMLGEIGRVGFRMRDLIADRRKQHHFPDVGVADLKLVIMLGHNVPDLKLGQPALAAAIMLYVAIALASAGAKPEVELFDVFVLAKCCRLAVEHDATVLQNVAML